MTVRQVRTWKLYRDLALVTRQVVRSKVSSYTWCSKYCASVFEGMYISGATNLCDPGRSFSGFLTFLLRPLLGLVEAAISLSRSPYIRKTTRTAYSYVHSPLGFEPTIASFRVEGPATGHLDTGFSWFPCVYKQMLRWFPRFQVATTCFSCSPPVLNLVLTIFMFVLTIFMFAYM